MDKLHSGAKWLFRLRFYSAVFTLFVFMPILIMIGFETVFKIGLVTVLFILLGVTFAIMIFFGEVYARLAYKNWRYEFGKDSVKLERGIIWKKYTNVPYNRIQNVDIHRGIFARILGFSTLDLQTAGASYSGRGVPRSEGHIPAVSVKKAEQLRDFLMGKISKRSNGM